MHKFLDRFAYLVEWLLRQFSQEKARKMTSTLKKHIAGSSGQGKGEQWKILSVQKCSKHCSSVPAKLQTYY